MTDCNVGKGASRVEQKCGPSQDKGLCFFTRSFFSHALSRAMTRQIDSIRTNSASGAKIGYIFASNLQQGTEVGYIIASNSQQGTESRLCFCK